MQGTLTSSLSARVRRFRAEAAWMLQPLLRLAETYYAQATSYRAMLDQGYNMIYGPSVDVASGSKEKREQSTLWKQNRIHTWRPDIATLFGSLTVASTQNTKNPGFFILKHAPGYGTLTGSLESCMNFAVDARSSDEILRDVTPFREMVERFGPRHVGVMVSGVVVPELHLEESSGGPTPFALSSRGIAWLRKELGAYGKEVVVITDDMGAPVFFPYYKKMLGKKSNEFVFQQERWRYLLKQLTNADVDMMVYFDAPPTQRLQTYLDIGRELLASGEITREQLEKSVFRILAVKRRMYPSHSRLQDLHQTVKAMRVEELLAQKLVLAGAWEGSSTPERLREIKEATVMGLGGLSFEGTQALIHLVQPMILKMSEEGVIPPFLANNASRELEDHLHGDEPGYVSESVVIREFTAIMDRYFPNASPSSLLHEIFLDIASSPPK